MKKKFEKALESKVIPVVSIHELNKVGRLADALVNGGLACAEITFRTDLASEAIKLISKRGDIISGAGTVLNVDQVKKAIDYGASFIVCPGISKVIVQYCMENGIPVIPGVCTPTELQFAYELGLEIVKYFPAEACGGINMLNDISAPYRMMKFLPTGGVNNRNMLGYLRHPNVIAIAGSWMVKSELIQNEKFGTISRLSREALNIARQAT